MRGAILLVSPRGGILRCLFFLGGGKGSLREWRRRKRRSRPQRTMKSGKGGHNAFPPPPPPPPFPPPPHSHQIQIMVPTASIQCNGGGGGGVSELYIHRTVVSKQGSFLYYVHFKPIKNNSFSRIYLEKKPYSNVVRNKNKCLGFYFFIFWEGRKQSKPADATSYLFVAFSRKPGIGRPSPPPLRLSQRRRRQ